MSKKSLKYIFVAGGVMSGVGKGVAAASIGKILQARGYEVTALKIDPYVNVDAGTMNPTEHGEVFVLDDGTECDQDMGNYERFLGRDLTGANYMTTGSVYLSVIQKERNLEYDGKCVEVVPHIPLEVIERINRAAAKIRAEVVIVEIGGTVGEYQNILFLEAVRMLKLKKPGDVLLALVSYLPLLSKDGELKTKPTQYAVRSLNAAGLQPDIILARAAAPIDKKRKDKIAFNCNVREEDVISAPDIESIYEIPVNFEKDNLSGIILEKLGLKSKKKDMRRWMRLARSMRLSSRKIKIGIVGKYFGTGDFILADSYISVIEAIKHAAYAAGRKPEIEWLNAERLDIKKLKDYDGIIVPGGFGGRGVEGKISAIRYCREKKIPFLGLCYGMQLAVVEFARNVAKFKRAHTTEVNPQTPHPVIDLISDQKEILDKKRYGGSMRLGAYPAVLQKGTIAYSAYRQHLISERHRHRYEVNPVYIKKLEKGGLIFSGFSPDKKLMEIAELPKSVHPFFVGSQFHPEFKSRPLSPHSLFAEFVRVAIMRK
ncbi:CTP synthase [Candidatus Wolfebacteria bacterium RIFCSPLOWO2_01_FULL_45_19]|uniref:CTP synthase n=1 Tax=Candidatus Wolfebacteria bacterium RIFCSPLOWO2_01_FULL_45_19 TaxID=1802557 RepID=A0A1F8DQ99_9BACT|nr:MAG: CTP synthase [Candidatus Wolfebacteria bacterium RIFCSPLOWO2_01_FULL_45_19]